MKLVNFEIYRGRGVELLAEGHNWDLHNFVSFRGFTYGVEERRLRLDWEASHEDDNPWGDPSNRATGCTVEFSGVTSILIQPRDPELGFEEDETLREVLPVRPGETTDEMYANASTEDETFALLFDFHGGASIEVMAETARLIPS